eukprot:6466612-Amphidinium_carterae.2
MDYPELAYGVVSFIAKDRIHAVECKHLLGFFPSYWVPRASLSQNCIRTTFDVKQQLTSKSDMEK